MPDQAKPAGENVQTCGLALIPKENPPPPELFEWPENDMIKEDDISKSDTTARQDPATATFSR